MWSPMPGHVQDFFDKLRQNSASCCGVVAWSRHLSWLRPAAQRGKKGSGTEDNRPGLPFADETRESQREASLRIHQTCVMRC